LAAPWTGPIKIAALSARFMENAGNTYIFMDDSTSVII